MSSGISYNKRFTRLYELDNYNSRDQQVTFFDRQVLMMLLFLCCLILTCIMFIITNCDSLGYRCRVITTFYYNIPQIDHR